METVFLMLGLYGLEKCESFSSGKCGSSLSLRWLDEGPILLP